MVEVIIALGIASFCLVAMLGLLPTGLKTAKNTTDQTSAATLLDTIAVDLRNTPIGSNTTPFYGITLLPAGTNTTTNNLFYFNEDGSMTNTNTSLSTRYGVWLTQTNPNSLTTTAQIQVFWPPSSVASTNSALASGILEDVVTINRK